MSEISRKNAISVLQMIEAHGSLPIQAKEKAISDMQKLEKIEEIFRNCDRMVSEKVFNSKSVCEEIEHILKGEEE